MEIKGIEREVKGWGSLWDLRGNTLIESRFFSLVPIPFDATGILFKQCIFDNCHPHFGHWDGKHGAEFCKVLAR